MRSAAACFEAQLPRWFAERRRLSAVLVWAVLAGFRELGAGRAQAWAKPIWYSLGGVVMSRVGDLEGAG